jgi:uncharacterized coiled-coil DUF342 family protein
MSQEITRWLAEVKTLQQQLAAIRQERDQAYSSAANWRQRYDEEARQRREEAVMLQATIATLRTELSTLRSGQQDAVVAAIESRLDEADLQTVEGLRTELIKALQAGDRLQKALEAERLAHAETRKTLTTTLGEAIDAMSSDGSR